MRRDQYGSPARVGHRARITVEGEIVRSTWGGVVLRADNGQVYPFDNDADLEILPDPVPEWRPGDVVVVDFGGWVTYTYVRGSTRWPGERARAKEDSEIDALYREGKARPVLQAGGAPFDPTRLP